jgi:hypothetical protein
VRPEELWESTVPKAQAPPSHEELAEQEVEEELQMEWRADEFMTQRPSAEERVWFIEKAVEILRFWHERGQRDRAKMDESLEWYGTSYLWRGYYFNTLQPAMERDGVLLHASYVVHGPVEVSERERAACEKLLALDREMQNLVWGMYEIDEENNARVREDVSRGVAQVSEWLEGISKGVPSQRGPEEGGVER